MKSLTDILMEVEKYSEDFSPISLIIEMKNPGFTNTLFLERNAKYHGNSGLQFEKKSWLLKILPFNSNHPIYISFKFWKGKNCIINGKTIKASGFGP